ncbi:MAG TPA: gamma-glutamyl-gamma-aminobutyrate hydrolase family protein [Mesorhizobium sp.]
MRRCRPVPFTQKLLMSLLTDCVWNLAILRLPMRRRRRASVLADPCPICRKMPRNNIRLIQFERSGMPAYLGRSRISEMTKSAKRKLVLIRHGKGPCDDRVSVFGAEHGYELEYRHPFDGDALGLPEDDVAGAVIFGGRFEAYETQKYPFLKQEARWIEACIDQGIPLLGICQGAQQIAHTLGGRVGPPPSNAHEFGYYPLLPTEKGRTTFPGPMRVTQAHFHTFDIPAGAVHLASSEDYPNQAFRYGQRTYAFQFHPEVTIEGFRRWQMSLSGLFGKPGAQTREEQDRLIYDSDRVQAAWFYAFLSKLFGTAKGSDTQSD